MFYRIKQFIWGLTEKLSKEDIILINTYLNEYDKSLFYKLPRNEQVHGVKVGKAVIEESGKQGLYDGVLIRAAFLHDIGKINSKSNLINKSIIVILHKLFPSILRKFMKIGVVNAYYNHPEMALGYLKKEDNMLKYFIRNHHNYYINQDRKLKILQDADSKN